MEEQGYQAAGTSQRHRLWRHPEEGWQVAVIALLAAIVFGAAGYLVGRDAASALVGAAVFGLLYEAIGLLRLRRARR